MLLIVEQWRAFVSFCGKSLHRCFRKPAMKCIVPYAFMRAVRGETRVLSIPWVVHFNGRGRSAAESTEPFRMCVNAATAMACHPPHASSLFELHFPYTLN